MRSGLHNISCTGAAWALRTTTSTLPERYRSCKSEPFQSEILSQQAFINQDYRDTLHFLEDLHPDICLGHHTEYFNIGAKRKLVPTEGLQAWVDPEGYRRWIATKRRAFEDEVDREMGVPKPK